MKHFLKSLADRRRATLAIRRRRALDRAVAERRLRETQDGSIWRSGKGGGHPDH